jgi:hypothetical protein
MDMGYKYHAWLSCIFQISLSAFRTPLLFATYAIPSLRPAHFLSDGQITILPQVKRLELEADHSLSSSAKVKNE